MDQRDIERLISKQDDPARDPRLADALRRAEPWMTVGIDVDRMAAAIVARARPRLTRLDAGGEWWEWAGRWANAAIPIAVAAGIAAAFFVRAVADPSIDLASGRTTTPAAAVAFAALASPVHSGEPLIDSLVGPATHEWLLIEAVGR